MEPMVLLIEDDLVTAKLVERQLGREGFSVLIAPNGFQGLKMAKANAPDLILLDLMLPGIDGFEVLNRLRADPQTTDLPVVIVSAKVQQADKQTAAKIGANAYLTKPYNRAELVALVRSLTDQKQAQATRSGTCVTLVTPHGGEMASVTLNIGLALVGQGKTTTIMDLRPFSAAHSLLLGLQPRSDLASFSDPQTAKRLPELLVQHASGLHVLNNLSGGGQGGQFTAADVQTALNALLDTQDFVLADVPLYPIDVLHQAASRSKQMLLVTRCDPISLGATRSALTMIQQAGVDTERTSIVFTDVLTEDPPPELGPPVLGTLPANAKPDDPTFHALADQLLGLM